MMINESRLAMLRRARARRLNESSEENVVSKEPEGNKNPGNGEWTFADWFGEDLSGKTYKGSIDCSYRGMTSLKGSPTKVTGDFDCAQNRITSLKGGPKEVGGSFYCNGNNITSLEGAPSKVGRSFYCGSGILTSLEGAPEIISGSFDCKLNVLKSLEGAPSKVGKDFDCSQNKLTSLEGAPEKVGRDFDCSGNNLPEDEFPDTEIGGSLVIDHATHLYRNQTGMKYNRKQLKISRFSKTPNGVLNKNTLKRLIKNTESTMEALAISGFLASDPEMVDTQKLLNTLNKLL
jgi:hypothetical protein